MARKWTVFKKNRISGREMSSTEIRDALREGEVDPFDLASVPGSAIKRPIIDIEEIFNTELIEKEAYEPDDSNADRSDTVISTPRFDEAKTSNKKLLSSVESTDRKSSKKFLFLRDRYNRRLGPLSAREILGLYARGALSKRVTVEHMGEHISLPIKEFVRNYSLQTDVNTSRRARNLDSNSLSSSDLAFLKVRLGKPVEGMPKNTFVFVMVAVLAVLAGFWGYKYSKKRFYSKNVATKQAVRNKASKSKKRPKLYRPASSQKKISPLTPTRRPSREPGLKPNQLNKIIRSKTADRKKVSKAPSPRRRKASHVNNKKSPKPVKTKPIYSRPPRAPKVSVNKTRKSAVPSPRGLNLGSKVGKTIVTQPASFNRLALQKCGVKCSLIFYDSGGNSFRGVFFRGAYEDVLKAKSRVRVVGTVRKQKDGFIIFVEDIK